MIPFIQFAALPEVGRFRVVANRVRRLTLSDPSTYGCGSFRSTPVGVCGSIQPAQWLTRATAMAQFSHHAGSLEPQTPTGGVGALRAYHIGWSRSLLCKSGRLAVIWVSFA